MDNWCGLKLIGPSCIKKIMYFSEDEIAHGLDVTGAGDDIFDAWFAREESEPSVESSAGSNSYVDHGVIGSSADLLDDSAGVAFVSCILELIQLNVPTTCQLVRCQEKVEVTQHRRGTVLFLEWVILFIFPIKCEC